MQRSHIVAFLALSSLTGAAVAGPLTLTTRAVASEPVPNRLHARVDPRVELLSIVFRLAGNFEYNMSPLKGYTADIDRYFSAYRGHPAILLAKRLAEERGVAADAVMAFAVHVSTPPAMRPLGSFADSIPEPRWGRENALEFARRLRSFYRDSHAGRFFARHAAFYRLAEARFDSVLTDFDLGWYRSFYGEAPPERFHLILGLNNGGGNYGPRLVHPGRGEELFSIVGCWTADSAGAPAFPSRTAYLGTVVHEFNHSFVNPAVRARQAELGFADAVYRPVAAEMQAMGYATPEIMLDESLVRGAVILYLDARRPQGTRARIRREQAQGFVWMEELCDVLRRYQARHAEFPTFASFMPEILTYFRGLAPRVEAVLEDYRGHCVHVTGSGPFANGAQDVDPATGELIVTFDKPLDAARGYSLAFGADGKDHFPVSGTPTFAPDGRSLRVPLSLKPAWSYSLALTPAAFASPDGYPLVADTLVFRTR